MYPTYTPSYSLTPMYGLGTYNRVIGATAISSPRTRIGSANRIYQYIKSNSNVYVASNYIQNAVFGRARILRNNTLILI